MMLLVQEAGYAPRRSITVCNLLTCMTSLSLMCILSVTDLLHQALSDIEKCDCTDDEGCPSCELRRDTFCIFQLTARVGTRMASCKESNAVASKLGAIVILRGVLGLSTSPDDIPDSGEVEVLETVVTASAVRTLGDVAVEPDTALKH